MSADGSTSSHTQGMDSFPVAAITNGHRLGGFKTTEFYSFASLEARNPTSSLGSAALGPEALGEALFLCLF